MDKFGRNYLLTVETASGTVLPVSLPFTIEFDITRNTLTSANVCQIRIYNLSLKNRNNLRFNRSNYGVFRAIELKAGYGGNLSVIFKGNVSQAWSVREGVNFITQIECYDGGFAFVNGKTNYPAVAGSPTSAVLTTIASTLPNVSLGAIGLFPDALSRGNSYSGPTIDILDKIAGSNTVFIDLSKINILHTNEYIATASPVLITSKSGLLGTPLLEESITTFNIIFEPRLNAGESVFLKSSTEGNFNGLYKIVGVKHRGMISAATCGTVVTTGEFFFSKILTPVQAVS